MARSQKRKVENYTHPEQKRVNNPPVGLVTPETDRDAGTKKTYAYDPHLDPTLQWAGKAGEFKWDSAPPFIAEFRPPISPALGRSAI